MDRIFPNRPSLRHWLHRLFASAFLLICAQAETFDVNNSQSSHNFSVTTRIRISRDPSDSLWFSVDGGSKASAPLTGGQLAMYIGYWQWSGLTAQNSPLTGQTTPGTRTIQFGRGAASNPPFATVVVEIPPHTVNVTYSTSGGVNFVEAQPIVININGDNVTVDNPHEDPDEEPEYVPGQILLDNQTGQEFDLQFGDEKIRVKPGLNAYPFFGAVGPDGLPLALPPGMNPAIVQGPDGQNYWGARLVNGVEGGYQWQQMEFSVSPPPNSSTGPIINVQGQDGKTTQYQLPQGMTKGNNLPIPNGVTPGGAIGLPPGMTPAGSQPNPDVPNGSNGSLPNGVISGGSNNLPPGVSPGVVPDPPGNPPPSTPQPGGGPGVVVGPNDTGTPVDGDWSGPDEVKPGPEHDVKNSILSLRERIGQKFGGLPTVQSGLGGGIGTLTTYQLNISLGALGSINETLDFGATPFPQIRSAILIFFWGILFVAFFKKITI